MFKKFFQAVLIIGGINFLFMFSSESVSAADNIRKAIDEAESEYHDYEKQAKKMLYDRCPHEFRLMSFSQYQPPLQKVKIGGFKRLDSNRASMETNLVFGYHHSNKRKSTQDACFKLRLDHKVEYDKVIGLANLKLDEIENYEHQISE
jgi:hypothetical protein